MAGEELISKKDGYVENLRGVDDKSQSEII